MVYVTLGLNLHGVRKAVITVFEPGYNHHYRGIPGLATSLGRGSKIASLGV